MVKQLIDEVVAGNLKTVKTLLAEGADVNQKNASGYSALQHAVWLGNIEATQLLIKHGACVSEKNDQGNTPLHIATWCSYRSLEVVAKTLCPILLLLLKHQANPNVLNKFGLTPLHHAVFYHFTEAVKVLLQYGARSEITIAAVNQAESDLPQKHWLQFEAAGFKPGMSALEIAQLKHHEALINLLSLKELA